MFDTVEDRNTQELSEKIKDDFLSLITHELRTPIMVITESLKVVQEGNASPEEVRDLIQNAVENAKILGEILENMLELTKYQNGQLKLNTSEVDIIDLLKKINERIRGEKAA